MAKKILQVGEIYAINLGDRVIAESLAYLLRKMFPDASVSQFDWASTRRPECPVPMNSRGDKRSIPRVRLDGPAFMKVKKGLKKNSYIKAALNTFRYVKGLVGSKSQWDRYTTKVSDADLIVVGGGQLLMDNSLTFPVRLFRLVKCAEKYNVPVVIFGVGVGGSWSRLGLRLLSRSLCSSQVSGVVVRDRVSKTRLESYVPQLRAPLVVGVDPALISKEVYVNCLLSKRESIGIGVICPDVVYRHDILHPLAQADFSKEFWETLTLKLLSEGKRVVLFSNGDPLDQSFARLIKDRVWHSSPNSAVLLDIAERPLSSESLVEIISGFEKMVAGRLHANIIAVSLGIPSVGLAWDDKVSSFYSDLGWPERCVKGDFYPDDVIARFEAVPLGDLVASQQFNEFLVNSFKKVTRKVLNNR